MRSFNEVSHGSVLFPFIEALEVNAVHLRNGD